jgi:hypothetical protein
MVSSPTSLQAVCEGCPLIVGSNSAILIPCDMTTDTDGDGAGDVCDVCPSDPTDSCNPDESAAASVGVGGGTVANSAGTAEVDLPPGALNEETSISITGYDPEDSGAGFVVGDGLVPAGNVFDFQPEMSFDRDVTITLSYEQGTMLECAEEETDLDVYWWVDPDWTAMGADQDCAANSLSFVTDHFSFYLIGAPDSDRDGVVDAFDQCPESEMSNAVVVDGCDTDVANLILDNGCSVSDLVESCAEAAGNHGRFVSCVSHLGNDLKRQGLVSGREKARLTRCAARANIP